MESRPPASPCVTCGAPVTGRFCAACGEKQLTPDDERLGRFLKEQLEETFSADGKLLRTVKALFIPGRLTVEYLEGRRGLYVRPIRIFLFVNLALFLSLKGSDGSVLKGPLSSHTDALFYGGAVSRMTQARADVWPGGMDAFRAAFDQHSAGLAPTLVFFLIPALACVLFLNRPRGSGVRHVVFATHAVSTVLALMTLLAVILIGALRAGVRLGWIESEVDSVDPVLVPIGAVLCSIYFVVSLRRIYGHKLWLAVVMGLLTSTIGFAFSVWSFRLALFLVSIWTLNAP